MCLLLRSIAVNVIYLLVIYGLVDCCFVVVVCIWFVVFVCCDFGGSV